MPLATVFDVLKSVNLHSLRLLLKDRQRARQYLSQALRRYYQLMDRGLAIRHPLHYVNERGWSSLEPTERIELPVNILTGGGMRLEELAVLALVTRALRPRTIFEIGTFMGRTTSVLLLNAHPAATISTLDLPLGADPAAAETACTIESDRLLVEQRQVGVHVRELGLDSRCRQIYCDSLQFDPEPHRNSVELGLIDGAHTRRHVENDTRKMAIMLAERGLVFWHDYGGRGSFRGLTEYLEELSRRISLYRVINTTLAWAPASELRKIV